MLRYLKFAYDLVDGSPQRTFESREVDQQVGLDDDQIRRIRRDLVNQGLLVDQGAESFSLRLPAIHQVEETRLDEGRADLVDPRREERGSYVRTLHELADGDTSEDVDVEELQQELGFDPDVEKRTREYLDEASLIEERGGTVRITAQGAEWAEG